MPIIIHGVLKQKEFKKPDGDSYLTFSSPSSFTLAVNNATKNWDGTLEYYNNGVWTTWDGTTTLSSEQYYDNYVLYLRGTGNTVITGYSDSDDGSYKWVLTGSDISCIGNIETLLDYATVEAGNHPTMGDYCYFGMFFNCTSLIQAPELPATTLASYCYLSMFFGCTGLTQAPELPATTLFTNCYTNMFHGCTSLIQAPELPATTLGSHCYMGMFGGCTALTQIPALPATTLADNCYFQMFDGCRSIKLSSTKTDEYTQSYTIPFSGTGTTATDALTDMFGSTGGTFFIGTPEINTTYYLSSDNMIVRDNDVATLNGYVSSMIESANAMQKADSFVENDIVVFDVDGNASDSNMKFVLNKDNSLTLQITV